MVAPSVGPSQDLIVVDTGDYMAALYQTHPRFNADVDSRTRAVPHFADVRAKFAHAHGGILEEYYSQHRQAIALRTGNGLHVHMQEFPQQTPEAATLVDTLLDAQRLAHELPAEESPQMFLNGAFGLITAILNSLDEAENPAHAATSPHWLAERMQHHRAAVTTLLNDIELALQRQAKRRYLAGMLAGEMFVLAFAAVAASAILAFQPKDLAVGSLLAAFTGGGLGAGLSVLSRLSTETFPLDRRAGMPLLRQFGAYRPAIGAVFGAAANALVAGGIVPLAVPSGSSEALLFYGGLGFLAGFSERFARDMLTVAEKKAVPA